MEFQCKLAHSNEIKIVSGFNSIKALYETISQIFSIPIDSILFCTLNTHDFRDMGALLCNYLSLGDLIVVHVCGPSRELTIEKTQQYLGLTITDNGHGRAFVKKTDSDQDCIKQSIKPGDHIAAINFESTIGMRHHEVAKTLRELPQNTKFKVQLVEPLHLEDYLDEKGSVNQGKNSIDLDADRPSISLVGFSDMGDGSMPASRTRPDSIKESPHSSYEDLTKSSLPIDKLLSKSSNLKTTALNSDSSEYRKTINRLNEVLETFVGINDNTLAVQIYRLAIDNKDSFERFDNAIKKSELANFKFDKSTEFNLWNAAIGLK